MSTVIEAILQEKIARGQCRRGEAASRPRAEEPPVARVSTWPIAEVSQATLAVYEAHLQVLPRRRLVAAMQGRLDAAAPAGTQGTAQTGCSPPASAPRSPTRRQTRRRRSFSPTGSPPESTGILFRPKAVSPKASRHSGEDAASRRALNPLHVSGLVTTPAPSLQVTITPPKSRVLCCVVVCVYSRGCASRASSLRDYLN